MFKLATTTTTIHQDSQQQQHPKRASMRISPPNAIELKQPATNKTIELSTNSIGSSRASKLRCSSMAKVPAAKSRIRQPIVMSGISISSNGVDGCCGQKSPPELTSPASSSNSTATLIRMRPTSLALKTSNSLGLSRGNTSRTTSTTAKTSSTLTKIQPASISSKKSQLTSTTNSKLVTGGCCSVGGHGRNLAASASSKKCFPLPSATHSLHPQFSTNRVNSSAIVNNKLSPTTTMVATTKLPTQQPTKLESVKVNLNNGGGCGVGGNLKDGERARKEERPSRESKQDGNQIATRHAKTTTTSNAHSLNLPSSSGKFKTVASSSATTAAAAAERHKNDQFALNNNSDNNDNDLLSVPLEATAPLNDKKQHGNIKQSDKHLPSHIRPSNGNQLKYSVVDTASLQQRTDGTTDRKKEDYKPTNNNSYAHEKSKSSAETKSSATISPATKFKRSDDNNGQIKTLRHALNDRLLPKPMGQQVLSLMMLDVGLLPANNLNQQLPSPPKSSYVSVQSPTMHETNVPSGSFIDDNTMASRIPLSPLGREAVARFNCPGIIDYNHSFKQCNDYNSLQPTTNANGLLQVRVFNREGESRGSISLPSSPRIPRYRAMSEDRFKLASRLQDSSGQTDDVRLVPIHRQSSTLIDGFHDKGETLSDRTTINPRNHNFHQQNQHSLLEHDYNQDNLSITSSSCSSLNHCPPMLTISDHLVGQKFDELVRSKLDVSGITTTEMNSAGGTITDKNETYQRKPFEISSKQRISVANSNSEYKNQDSEKIDCFKSPGRQRTPQDRCDSTMNQEVRNIEPDSTVPSWTITSENNLNQQDPQLRILMESTQRRQTQLRSHSISGQEFHASGGYHRLKNLMYNNQNGTNNYDSHQQQQHHQQQQQQYAGHNNNRMLNFATSPYQQQSQHLIGRSPSPSQGIRNRPANSPISNHQSISSKYNSENALRNPLHSSLECLNSMYIDYQQQQMQHQQMPSYSHMQRNSQQPLHNQHYAASYVLAQPPANSMVNQNGNQDLAAAAMGAPPPQTTSTTPNIQQYQSNHPSSTSTYNINNSSQQQSAQQTIINRAMAHVSQSPLRRMGLNQSMLNTSTNISSSALLTHLSSSLHHPMRAGHSSLSLASSSYMAEDKLQNEIRKLQSDLKSEKEKNDALNNQLDINSGVMAAFEQSIITLNDRLRQLTTLNEKKDDEIRDLKDQMNSIKHPVDGEEECLLSSNGEQQSIINTNSNLQSSINNTISEKDNDSDKIRMMREIEDLKRQLTIKDRLLTDTRLEAISVAHQLEQLESKLNGEHSSLLNNEDDLDEGVMVVNHSPSDSDAVTDSAHFSEINNQMNNNTSQYFNGNNGKDNLSSTPTNISVNHNTNRDSNGSSTNSNNNNMNNDTNSQGESSPENMLHIDEHSNHSSEFHMDKDQSIFSSIQYADHDDSAMDKLMDKLLLSN